MIIESYSFETRILLKDFIFPDGSKLAAGEKADFRWKSGEYLIYNEKDGNWYNYINLNLGPILTWTLVN